MRPQYEQITWWTVLWCWNILLLSLINYSILLPDPLPPPLCTPPSGPPRRSSYTIRKKKKNEKKQQKRMKTKKKKEKLEMKSCNCSVHNSILWLN